MRLQRPPTVAVLSAAGATLATFWVALLLGLEYEWPVQLAYAVVSVAPGVAIAVRAARVPVQRWAWGTLAAALCLWNVPTVWLIADDLVGVWTGPDAISDGFWIVSYALMFVALGMLAWPWLRRAPRGLALEMLGVTFGLTALVTAILVPMLLADVAGLSLYRHVLDLTYPIADCALLSVALIGSMVLGRRDGRVWALLAAGALALTLADSMWALASANGTLDPAMASSALYPLWPGLAAIAAYLPGRINRASAGGGVGTHAAALMAAVVSVVLLVANEWLPIPAASVALAALSLLVAVHGTGRALLVGLRAAFQDARERDLVEDVREALHDGELDVYFQPLVDVATGEVRGAEALLRWRRPDGVFIAPDRFLPAVERSELMGPLTDWVLDRALAAAAGWHRSGHRLGVSVNLATANLNEADLAGRVLTALRRNELPAEFLTLEITETEAIVDNAMAGHVLRALRELGVELSVDDFGTGHSSLIRLADFPIGEVKIDRSFVAGMHAAQRPIVAAAVQVARSLGMRVVAEGVEDQLTLDALAELRCDLAQGFYISRPLPAAEFAGWLAHPSLVA